MKKRDLKQPRHGSTNEFLEYGNLRKEEVSIKNRTQGCRQKRQPYLGATYWGLQHQLRSEFQLNG